MYVVKRDGRQESVHFDKITARLKKLSYGLSIEHCDPVLVSQKVCAGVYKGVTTSQLDELAAETAAAMTANHPDYASLAARIVVSNLHKNTKKSYSETIKIMYNHFNEGSGLKAPLVADDVYEIIMKNASILDSEIIYDRDFDYDYFGFKTLERSYLLKVQGKVVERPQHMLMRVAVGIHKDDIDSALKTYHLMSQRWFTHASPTLFNAGTPRPQLSSCFLVCMKDDSIEGIYDTLKECAVISKSAGGIGVSIHNIRATSSYIRGTNGTSNGIVPMLRVFNDTARYVDQGGGKRKGAFAVYLEPWHADIFEFLDLRKNHGKEEHRARGEVKREESANGEVKREEELVLNDTQFSKLDELLTQTQLYSQFLLKKMDDITFRIRKKSLSLSPSQQRERKRVERGKPSHKQAVIGYNMITDAGEKGLIKPGEYSETVVAPRASILETEVESLNSMKADLVAQLVNYIQYRALLEGWTSCMWTKYMGVLIWKTQNPWTGLRGQFYDHLHDQTMGFYGCCSAAEPIHVQLNLETYFAWLCSWLLLGYSISYDCVHLKR